MMTAVQGGAIGGAAVVLAQSAGVGVSTGAPTVGASVMVQPTVQGQAATPADTVTVIEVETSPDGASGETFVAGGVVSGDKALMFMPDGTLAHADPTHGQYVYAGIALNSAQPGGQVTVKRDGILSTPFWSWIFGKPVFTSPGGNLTQDPPTIGYSHIVAFAIGATSLRLVDDDLIMIGDSE